MIKKFYRLNYKELEGDKMKEYKVELITPSLTSKKGIEKMEYILNDLATQGWEFKFLSGAWMIFEREK